LLLKFMQRTYQEVAPAQSFEHLAVTVEHYFSKDTPLWWVDLLESIQASTTGPAFLTPPSRPVACLWVGTAIDQSTGDRHAHIFLLYVDPAHRRRGIGTALMQQAETWAKDRGDQQIGLQVFQRNLAALALYTNLGFEPRSIWMVKPLS
jgi:ribosomal protein S18 acetylase RimI-like enzyme